MEGDFLHLQLVFIISKINKFIWISYRLADNIGSDYFDNLVLNFMKHGVVLGAAACVMLVAAAISVVGPI